MRRFLKTGIAITGFLLFSCLANAQDSINFAPPAIAPQIYATGAKGNIVVDGKLNEPAWQSAPVIKDFFRVQPRQGGNYFFETAVKIIYDKKNLYFGVFCKDAAGRKGIRVQDYRRDFTSQDNDLFMVQLDPQRLKRFCVSFQATPLGTQGDMQVFDDQLQDPDWDGLWRVKTLVTDSGYYAEFAIPFKSLRYQKQTNDSVSWNISFSRIARRDFEQTVFPKIPQSYNAPFRMAYGAALGGLVLPPPSLNIRAQPYALYQYDRNTDGNAHTASRNYFKTGGEIKWALNPHAVLDASFNTDFAQADVDRAVNNLKRFNLFFPEKRQFFLENQGVFAGADVQGLKPFFSRSIGLSNTQFDAAPVPIDAGLRFVDRTRLRTFAALYVHQRATAEQGAANFGVFRYLKNYGQQNNIGLMLTDRLDEGDPAKGFLRHNNSTLTVDGLIRPDNKWTIRYLASASGNNGADSIGFAGNFRVQYVTNQFFFYYNPQLISSKYKPGMGFVFQNDVLYHQTVEFISIRPKKWKWLREWELGFDVNYYQKASTLKFQQADIYFYPLYLILNNGGLFQYAFRPNWERIDLGYSILGMSLASKRYAYALHQFDYNTDPSKHLSFKSDYTFGSYYNGSMQSATIGCRLAPSPKIAVTADYSHTYFRHVGKEQVNLETNLYTAELRLAWNPQLQLSAFYQYNSFNKQGQWNARASWEFSPLSFIYIVYNQNDFKGLPVKNQSLISKISYLKQF